MTEGGRLEIPARERLPGPDSAVGALPWLLGGRLYTSAEWPVCGSRCHMAMRAVLYKTPFCKPPEHQHMELAAIRTHALFSTHLQTWGELDAYVSLVKRCWAQAPQDRPRFKEVIADLR